MNKTQKMVLAGILVSACVMRSPIAALGALVGKVSQALVLTKAAIGMVTTLMVAVFALTGPLVGYFRLRFGASRSLMCGAALIILGLVTRSFLGVAGLYIGTVIMGAGISFCNVLLPATVKEHFPNRIGSATGAYLIAMYTFAALSSAVSVPLAGLAGWQLSLLAYAPVALLALILWSRVPKSAGSIAGAGAQAGEQTSFAGMRRMLRSPLAWWITLLMGSQSLIYYCALLWLPTIAVSRGFTEAQAGAVGSIMQVSGIAGAIISTLFINRLREQYPICLTIGATFVSAIALMAFGTGPFAFIVCAVLIGLCASSSFGMVHCIISFRAANAKDAVHLSGMAQSFGYGIAAIGPALMGKLYDSTQSWLFPLALLGLCAILYAVAGLKSGRQGCV